MNHPNTLPYCVPATDGRECHVFVLLPAHAANGDHAQSVPLSLTEARALAIELLEAAQTAQDKWGRA